MKLFNKKVTLSFYAYSSVILLLIFLATTIIEHNYPTNIYVKSLIAFCSGCFSVVAIIYLINEIRRKPVIIFFFFAAFIGLLILYFFNGPNEKNYNLQGNYVKNICKYEGANYKEGFALSDKIDDCALAESSLWQTLLKSSITHKDTILFKKFMFLWWHNLTKDELLNSSFDEIKTYDKESIKKYTPGDMIIRNNHIGVFVKYINPGKPYSYEKWITSTQEKGVHIFTAKNSAGKYTVYKWTILDNYKNR